MRRIEIYIYEHSDWPNFKWNDEDILFLLGKVRNLQGKLVGKMSSLGFELQNDAILETLILDVIKSTEIEGEILSYQQVRYSVAKRLGMNISGLLPSSRDIDGIVDMMFDATHNFNKILTKERLFNWHCSLFPTGRSGMYKILTGQWRNDASDAMQVVSGAIGKEKIHFQAPDSSKIESEIKNFINWINEKTKVDLVIKAGITHLWFVTIHPFDDGNGRIARAITDMFLAQSDGIPQRFYSMSAQIEKERKNYYNILEKTQKGSLNITDWLNWFLNCLLNALHSSEKVLANVIYKHKFWNRNAVKIQNTRQQLLLNKLLEGFDGKLTSSKWAKIAKCSPDTALRDIQDLINKQILCKAKGGGRSTNYKLVEIK